MSTTVDQRVVEMRFDNRHFEKNTRETMSTLDKLKQKLNFSGASKGLENINSSANKVNMSGMSNALDNVRSKFSALEVVGITALANITNSAVNAGKRIVKSLTVDPVMDGWKEYELTMNTIQTIMNSTGKSADEIQKKLKALDDYADKTVYSTADMFNNIYKFTNAGIDLDTATQAMIGIANATADAGQGAQQASIAYYNLAQSLSTGYLTTIDYKSLNLANIMTNDLKKSLAETAVKAGTLTKAGDGLYAIGKSQYNLQQLFTEALKDQWATADVLMEVFGEYADAETEVGKRAWKAATEVKTFTGMMESLKATAGTGWKETWQIIFGDLDEAKEFWTGISNFLGGIISSVNDFRNKVLESALGRSFKAIVNTMQSVTEPIKHVSKTVQDYNKLVDQIIRGDFKNAPVRFQLLAEAGYDWAHAQNLVNERLGFSKRYATNYGESQKELAKNQEKVTKSTTDYLLELIKLSDAQLKSKGYSDEQIKAFREIEKVAKQTGISLKDFVENIDKIDGRWILINSFKNIGKMLTDLAKTIKQAWNDIFNPGLNEEQIIQKRGDGLFNIIAALHKLTTYLPKIRDENGKLTETGDKFVRTFKGIFAIVDLVTSIIGGGFKFALKVVSHILSLFNLDILGFTALLGDGLVKIRDWIKNNLYLGDIIKFVAETIVEAVRAVKSWIENNKEIQKGIDKFKDSLSGMLEKLKSFGPGIKDWIKGLKDAKNIPKYIFDGLINGLKNGASTVFEFVINFGKGILDSIKGVLGIHSPSTEFFEIGKNIVQGLFNGIGSLAGTVYNLVLSIGKKLIDIVQSLDIGSIFTIAIGTGFAFGVLKIGKAIDRLTSPLDGLNYVFVEFGDTLKKFQGVLGAAKFRLIAESLKTIAVALAILAGSIIALSFVDTGKMWIAIGAMATLVVLLGALVAVAGHFGGDKGIEFGKVALVLLGLGVSMALMAKAVKTLANIDPNQATQAIGSFVVVVLAMMGLIAVANKSKTGFLKLGSAFLGMATALLLMSVVTKILGGMDEHKLKQGLMAIVAFSAIVMVLMATTKLLTGSKNVDKIGKTIGKIGTAILMMAIVAKLLGGMDEYELKQGFMAIVAFSAIIVGLMAATKLINGSKNVDKIGGTIFKIAGAFLIMALVARVVSSMSIGELAKGVAVMAVFGGIVTGLIAATKLVGGKKLDKVGATMILIAGAIGILAITAAILSLIDLASLAKGVVAVSILSAVMMGLIYVTKNIPKGAMGTMIAMTVAIGILVLSAGLLSIIDPAKLASATIAISALLGMLALVITASKSIKKAYAQLVVITVAIGVLAGALYLIAQLPADRALSGAVALSILLGAMAGTMVLLSKFSKMSKDTLLGVAGLALLCIPLYILVDVLSRMQNVTNAAANAAALGQFMIVLSVVQLLCAASGAIYTATGGMAMLGLVGMVALVGTLYLLMGALALMNMIPNAISSLEALKSFMVTMTAVLVVLAIVGPLALIGVTAMAALTSLIVAIGALAVGIGYLLDKIPSLEEFLNKGIPILVKIANGVGQMIGAFVGGVMTQISSTLPQIGTDLSLFMTNLTPFIDGAKNIDKKMLDGVKNLAATILIITGSSILEGLTSWLTGGKSISKFGEQIGELGTYLKTFTDNLGTFDDSKVNSVNAAAKVLNALAKVASSIPNEGGLWGKIAGENSIATFGKKLPDLAKHISGFVNNLGTFDESKVTSVECAAKAITAIAEAAAEIPNDGGVAGWFAGNNDLSVFGAKLPALGIYLNQFISNLGTFGEDQIATVKCAGKAITALANAAAELPNEGGVAGFFAGDNDISKFGEKLPELAKNIKEFVDSLGIFKDGKIETIYTTIDALNAITHIGSGAAMDDGDTLGAVGKKIVKFSKQIKTFVENLSEVGNDGIKSAISKVKKISSMAVELAKTDVSGITTLSDSLKKLGKNGVKGFVSEFSGATPKSDAKKAARALIDAAIDGAESKRDGISKKFKSLGNEAIKGLKSHKSDATSIGKDFVQGFVNGINNNVYLARNAGSKVGREALNAAKKAIDSNSPSKETMKLGNYFGQGFAIGIDEYGNKIYDTSYSVGDSAKKGLSKAIAKISNAINTDIDSQPTIRPVLDLSNVESGAGYLNSIFNNGPSIGVMSNLSAISSGMNARGQNGTNNDVVSAIDKLRKGLGNVNGTTNNFNVNGISYDDGTNISEAVRTLIRAAKIERRV